MTTLKAVVWNMEHKWENWNVLREWRDLKDSDVALLSEASRGPAGVRTLGDGKTEGLEVALGPDRPVKRDWSTLIASRHRMTGIKDARLDRSYGRPLPFAPSRPGTWTAASVELAGVSFTAISVYGLLDERSDASVNRSLSELSPIFDHKTYAKHLLLGGDLNILANPRVNDPFRDRHLAVLTRIKAYRLVDCLEKALVERRPGRSGLPGCPCGLGDRCLHTWTKLDPKRTTVPYQDDYLFASRALVDRLTDCFALPFGEDPPSDHAPIVATFDL